MLEALEVAGRVLVVLQPSDTAPWKSLRNLGDVHVLSAGELNAYDVLVSDWIIFTTDTLPTDTPRDQTRETKVTVGNAAQPPGGAAEADRSITEGADVTASVSEPSGGEDSA